MGIDSNAENLAEISRKAARKPARGGAKNAMFVRASVEALPEELAGLAARVTILLPWGSLLRALAEPDPAVLAGVRGLCRAGASLEVVMSVDGLGDVLPGYRDAGFAAAIAPLPIAEVRRLGTTWASRLAFGRPRSFWRISAIAI